jgi:hypothetical protein
MQRELRFKPRAVAELSALEADPAMSGVLKQVRKTLGYLETDLRSKSLQTHKFDSLSRIYNREIFEAYAQQKTPAAYRVFWHYGPDETDSLGSRIAIITIVAITPHP